MSWFEKAKTVIIEALDIQDDDSSNNSNKPSSTSDTAPAEKEDVASESVSSSSGSGLPSLPTNPGGAANEGMSLTDASPTFYDNPHANEMVTIAPKASDSGSVAGGPVHLMAKRQSATSDSVDLLSSPSPTSPTAGGSEGEIVLGIDLGLGRGKRPSESSLELITATTASELEMSPDTEPSLPDSIVIIASNETSSDNDDESGQLDGHHLNDSTKTMKALVFSDTQVAANVTSTGADSDSTHSFEDIQMQMQLSQKSKGDFEMESGQIQQQQQLSSKGAGDVVDQSYSSTSSDIEIISNPNGGDSSTNSTTTRTSPQKLKELESGRNAGNKSSSCSSSVMMLKPKGHHREPSEISLLSQDSQTEELDKLVKRISELNQVIEVREQRLLQSERQNSELLERNQDLLAQLELANNRANNPDATEAVQRLSALEKKFQTSIQERDALRIQIKSLKDELLNKIPKDELTECNDMIAGLQSEGEKLSKEILQQSIIIKKLRAKEKTSDTLLKKNGEQISLLSSESERLKRSLAAKEEMERTQIEAVFKMTSEKRRVDEENAEQRSRIEDLQSKLSALESSFEALKGDLQKRTRLEQDNLKAENQEHLQQITDLREKLRLTEHNLAKREQHLREENRQLMQRLEMAELRAESSTHELSVTTTPLIRQIESLQRTLNQRSESWQREEQHLIQRLEDSQIQLRSLQQLESVQEEKQELMRTRCSLLEEKLSNAQLQAETAKSSLRQQLELENINKEDDYQRQLANLREELRLQVTKNEQLEEQIKEQEIRISAEHQHNHHQQQQQQQQQQQLETSASSSLLTVEAVKAATAMQPKTHPRCSPPPSLADESSGSQEEATLGGGMLDWQADDLDCGSNSGRQHSGIIQGVHLSFLSANTTTLEHLQALLKQRDGELTHLQWELSRLQAERGVLDGEISNLTIELEMLKEKLIPYEAMEKCYEDLQHRYDALLQMYGEKVERTEELELDLVELKQAYKLQIDELLAAPPPNLKRPEKQT